MSHAQVLDPKPALTAQRGDEPAVADRRVLVVEDDSIIRDVIVDHLRSHGFVDLELASSIPEARASLARELPSVIILDLMLPRQSGLEFLHERRRDPSLVPIPVVVISAAPQDLITEAQNLGADALVTKPFNLDELAAIVSSFVGPVNP
jgi:CheY-like chemotaxis protein